MYTPPIPRKVRRAVLLVLVDRVEDTFPEDWSRDLSVREVVRRWLQQEADR
jgi:hypothetical protein